MSAAPPHQPPSAGPLAARVAGERARVRTSLSAAGATGATAAVLGAAAAGGLALGDARWLALPAAVPWLVWAAAGAGAGAVAWWARGRVRDDASLGAVAGAVERERALRDGALRGALEVEREGALGAFAARHLAAQLPRDDARLPLAPAWQRRARRAFGGASLACGAALVALVATGAAAGDGLRVLAHPVDAARGTLLPPIRLSGAAPLLARGTPVQLRVEAPGRHTVRAAWRAAGRGWTTRDVRLDARGAGVLALGPADASLVVVASDGRATSDSLRVRVGDRAYVGDVVVRAEYPAYLGRAAEALAAGDVLRVPRGTVLVVRARATVALRAAALVGAGGAAAPLAVRSDDVVEGRVAPAATGRWTWRATAADGAAPELPAALDVVVLADSLPSVVLASPGDSTIDGLAPLRARVVAGDDHGLAGVTLRAWVERAGGTREAPVETRLAGAVPAWAGEAVVSPEAFQLRAGDRLHLVAVAVDASPWRQAAASREVVLRVPSARELREGARAAADSAVARAASLAAAGRELQQRTGDAAVARDQRVGDTRGGGGGGGSSDASREGGAAPVDRGEMTREAAERARGVVQESRQLADKVGKLREEAAALERQLRQAGALDPALAKQLQDVQQLLRDALTPAMQQQLAALEQGAQQLDAPRSREALQQLAEQQRAMRAQLERSVDMLKRAALEGAMQTLADEARDLAAEQRAAGERMARAGEEGRDGERAAARELAERARDLTRDVGQLGDRLAKERAAAGARRAEEAERDAERSAARMAQAAQGAQGAPPQSAQPQGAEAQGAQAQAGRPQDGRSQPGGERGQPGGEQRGERRAGGAEAAREAAQAMQGAAQRLAQARQQQIEQWKGELTADIDRAVQETMQLAREQQSLEREARAGADARETQARQSALQQAVEQTARRLDEAGKTSSLLSQRSQRAMQDAQQQVGEAARATRQPGGAPGGPQPGAAPGAQPGGQATAQQADAMREAGDALQRAAAALVRDRERVNAAESATGFEELVKQMQQLAGQQGQINQQAGGLPIPMPGAAGQGARDARRQLAQRQQGVAERLEALGDADPTGRSDALAREARQLAQQLERAAPGGELAQRQQQLYRRLLDAGRTLERDERDDSGKREARSGGGVAGVAPADGAASGANATRYRMPTWEELRGLSAEERRVVLDYFRRLNGAP